MNVTEIRARLVARKGEWLSLKDDAQVSYSWLSKFANDRIPSPGVATLQRLESALDARDKATS